MHAWMDGHSTAPRRCVRATNTVCSLGAELRATGGRRLRASIACSALCVDRHSTVDSPRPTTRSRDAGAAQRGYRGETRRTLGLEVPVVILHRDERHLLRTQVVPVRVLARVYPCARTHAVLHRIAAANRARPPARGIRRHEQLAGARLCRTADRRSRASRAFWDIWGGPSVLMLSWSQRTISPTIRAGKPGTSCHPTQHAPSNRGTDNRD